MYRPALDEYVTPYLVQAVSRGEPTPISRRVVQTTLRARVDALFCLRAFARCLGGTDPFPPPPFPTSESSADATPHASVAAEDAAESGRFAEATTALDRLEPAWAETVARAIMGDGSGLGRPGYLVLNPVGVSRQCAVLLPDASTDLRPEGPLRAAQAVAEGTWAVVDLPAFGFAWVPREPAPDLPLVPDAVGTLSVKGQTLRSEALEVEIDERTGGIHGLRALGEPFVRLGQQLVILGLNGSAEGKAGLSRMIAERF
jgi:alpha-mannosidase